MITRPEKIEPLEAAIDAGFRRNFSRFVSPDFAHTLWRFLAKAGTIHPFSVSVGLAAVKLVDFNPNRIRVSIFNNGAATIYYGGKPSVTAGSVGDPNAGFPLLTSTGIVIRDTTAAIWAISGTAAQDVRIDDVTLESL